MATKERRMRARGRARAYPHHEEAHGAGAAMAAVRDLVLGMADGLTVPFALAAGITSAIAGSGVVLTAGVAELVGGAISMGLGGYLAARTDVLNYRSEYAREVRETEEIPDEEWAEVAQILSRYGLREPVLTQAVNEIARDKHRWVDFMMRNELGLERPDDKAAARSALFVGGGYVLGGIFPLAPYAFISEAHQALWWSIGSTSLATLAFGAGRAKMLNAPILRGALQTWLIGGIAAAAAYFVARLLHVT
jgi:VIT1/CCC1 family predicted Fe2+/Mn2+ transporter